MEHNLFITDARMLEVMRFCIANNVQDVRFKKDWCELVGCDRLNLPKIEKGKISFQSEQLLKCAQIFNINMNWLYGLENNMFRLQASAVKAPPAKPLRVSSLVNVIGNTSSKATPKTKTLKS